MCKNWTSTLLSIGAALSIVLGAATLSLGGKPGGGGGKPAPPPVLYRLTWLGTLGGEQSKPLDINNQGEVVGWAHATDGGRRAFVYTATTGMVDLNAVAPLPDGWIARTAYGINELGQIVGSATHDIEGTRAFFYDPTVQPPQSMLLPTIGSGAHSARSINDLGHIVALYNDPELGDHTIVYKWDDNLQPYVSDIWLRPGYPVKINNQGQILHHWWPSLGGLPARYTPPPGPGWEAFDFVETVQGMNEHGTIVGRTWVKRGQLYATRPNGGTDAFYRFTDPNQVDILLTGNVWTGDGGVNNVGDACGRTNVRDLFVYTDRDGLLWVNNLVIGNDSDIAVWMSMYILAATGITDRDAATGFGQICCWGSTAAGTEIKYTAFLLTPMKP